MRTLEAKIQSHGGVEHVVTGELPDLRKRALDRARKPIRRIGRYTQLAIIGAAECVGDTRVPTNTGVYIGARHGDLGVTIDLMRHVLRDGEQPKPFNFVNSVTNAACFYLARRYDLRGRSCFVGANEFGFENALALALLDLHTANIEGALVGAVDIATQPLDAHKQRLGVTEHDSVCEASHWLWLTPASNSDHASARISVTMLPSKNALGAYIEEMQLSQAHTAFTAGQYLSEGDAADVGAQINTTHNFQYRADRPHHDCQASAVVSAFLNNAAQNIETLVHVNGDPSGRLAIMCIRRATS